MTSQIFANVYLNEFDYFIKHKLKIKNFVRYTDDFVIVSESKNYLTNLLPKIENFLSSNLKLSLHPDKVEIRKFNQGIDFLGYVVLPNYIKLRSKTERRIFKKLRKRIAEYKVGEITKYTLEQSLNSYLGTMSHANTFRRQEELKNNFWFWLSA